MNYNAEQQRLAFQLSKQLSLGETIPRKEILGLEELILTNLKTILRDTKRVIKQLEK